MVLCLLSAMLPLMTYAQLPGQMDTLVTLIMELRCESSDDDVYAKLSGCADKWTLMDEIMNSDAECSRSVRRSMPHFGLNDIAFRVAAENYGMFTSAGNFCDGMDPRYNYSFIEKTILAESQAEYLIPGRTGKQIFVVIPFRKGISVEACLHCGGRKYMGVTEPAGNIVIEADAGDKADSPLLLSIVNHAKEDAAYVIVNYNSRLH